MNWKPMYDPTATIAPALARRSEPLRRMPRRTSGAGTLRSMATNDLLKDPNLEGFTVIASWLKAQPASGQQAVMETAAAFVPKALVANFLRGQATVAQLAEGAYVMAWDGETKLGAMKPRAWADDFVLTYKVAGYTPDPKINCN